MTFGEPANSSSQRPEATGKRLPFCSYPWFFLGISPETYQPCCYLTYRHESLPDSQDAITALFNSPPIRQLRKKLAAHDVDGLRCKVCPLAGYPFPEFPTKTAASFLAKEEAARAAYAAHDAACAGPLLLHMVTSHDCNIKCIMCHQRLYETRTHAHIPRFPEAVAHSLLSGLDLPALGRLHLAGGGELFFAPDGRAALQALLEKDTGDTVVGIVSNGLLLGKYLDRLERIRHLHISISVDGYAEHYEHIRAGGSWKVVRRNLEALARLRKKHPGWQVNILSIVMKSSLSSLEDLVRMAHELDVHIAFGKVLEPLYQENIFMFPDLLEGLPWEEDFARAIRAAEDLDRPDVARNLRIVRDELAALASGERLERLLSEDYGSNDSLRKLIAANEEALRRGPLVLLGLSQDAFMALAMLHDKGIPVAAIADYDSSLHGRRIYSIPVVSPDELGRSVPAGVVGLTCLTKHWANSRQLLREQVPEAEVVLLNAIPERPARRIARLVKEIGDQPVVFFGGGGFLVQLLDLTPLAALNAVAVADSNPERKGQVFQGLAVIGPDDIPQYATNVVITSEAYEAEIMDLLKGAFPPGALAVHPIFFEQNGADGLE